jgi:hypothetical protein
MKIRGEIKGEQNKRPSLEDVLFPKKWCPKGSYYVIDWGGLSDVEKIYEFLYRDSNIFLQRKRETFDKVISITKDKNKYRK